MNLRFSLLRNGCLFLFLAAMSTVCCAEDKVLHTFSRQQLTDIYFSEGANAGDLNQDGQPDVVYGPYWYEGPSFAKAREIYPPVPQDREKYAAEVASRVKGGSILSPDLRIYLATVLSDVDRSAVVGASSPRWPSSTWRSM